MKCSPPTKAPLEDPRWLERVERFRELLGIPREQVRTLRQALTHRSLSDVASEGDNERLEFLGDSVLALLVNDFLYQRHPDQSEGTLTRLKALYVCEASLAEAAAALRLGDALAMASSDEMAGGRERVSTLSDAFEAVLAAVYLTRGLEAAREFVNSCLIARVHPQQLCDPKSRLQELYQEKRRTTPTYRTLVESGPAHDRVFVSEALIEGEVVGTGTGRSKKVAEQAAASDALARLEKPVHRSRKKSASPASRDVGSRAS